MCGIVGYTGKNEALPVVTGGLFALEYRGYDSSGVAVLCGGKTEIVKKTGKLENLMAALEKAQLKGTCGIGHTRWATHGEVTETNAHPHAVGKTVLVHNGIIENYVSVGEMTKTDFKSTTDTERACALFNELYERCGDGILTITSACREFVGSYAFLVMFKDEPDIFYAVRNGCPLVVGTADGGFAACSDVAACDFGEYYKLSDGDVARVTKDGISFFDNDGAPIEKEALKPKKSFAAPDKCGFPHYMLKEMEEIPTVLKNTLEAHIKDGLPYFEGVDDEIFKNMNRLRIVGCGTAYHAGLVCEHISRRLTGIEGDIYIASEYRYSGHKLNKDDAVIFITQSGETADTLACIRMCKAQGAYTLGVVNVPTSTAVEECDGVILTHAGSEIAVASTKAYVTQLAALYLIVLKMSLVKGTLTEDEVRGLCGELLNGVCAESRLSDTDKITINRIAEKYSECRDMFYIGRGLDSVLCSEASLKLKEISYVHSEAYPSGELKHGTISLITEGVGVFAILTDERLYLKSIGNIEEAAARGGSVIALCKEGFCKDKNYDLIPCRISNDLFAPFAVAPRFQYFAYCMTIIKNLDPDKPRNLAKSVTVE